MSCCQASFCRTSPTEGGAGKGQIFLYVLLRFFMAELRMPMIVIDDSGIVAAYSGHRDRWSGRRHGLPDKLYDCLIRGAFQPPHYLRESVSSGWRMKAFSSFVQCAVTPP